MTQSNSCCDTQPSLLSLDTALESLLSNAKPTRKTESVSLADGLGRILAVDVVSEITVPPHDNSAVDGYALALDELGDVTSLRISSRIPAGSHPEALEPNTAARIFTGATIPEGANCVVMQENCNFNAEAQTVEILQIPSKGQNIRSAGQDIQKGSVILTKGTKLKPQHLGLLASIGLNTLVVYEPLTIAILSTGDELVEPGQPLGPSQIYNSNRYLLQGLLKNFGMNVLDLGVVKDKLEATEEALAKASETADIIITTGGASVGEEDHIQSAIKNLGSIDFWRIAIKPGKPFMLGEVNSKPVLGLPGNPGAVLVTFLILARPFILTTQGQSKVLPTPISAELGFSVRKPGKRKEFLRVKYEEGVVFQHQNQSSGMLSSSTWAEGLAVINENTTPEVNSKIDYFPFSTLLSD